MSSLYINIPIKHCIPPIDLFCRSKGCEITALITELSVFTNNYSKADVLYLTNFSMGTPLAVSAAVIYMARLELTSSYLDRFIDNTLVFYLEW